MGVNEYHFVTHWRVQGTAEEVYDVLNNPLDLPRWWPSVYLSVKQMNRPGGVFDSSEGAGADVFELHTKGWLPYTLCWRLRQTESQRPRSFRLQAWGDFDGTGLWTFAQDGHLVDITYDWRIKAEKPLLRYLSFLFKPIFSANHRWAMEQGEKSLKRELARRHS